MTVEGMLKMASSSSLDMEEKEGAPLVHEQVQDCQNRLVKKEDKLELAKAEMGEVREENERLKMTLNQVENNYQSLQLRFFKIVQREGFDQKEEGNMTPPCIGETEEPDHLVSLCLGRSPKNPGKNEKSSNTFQNKEQKDLEDGGLSLGLDSKFQSSTDEAVLSNLRPSNRLEDKPKEIVEASEAWQMSNVRTMHKSMRNEDDESSQQMPAKRARVCVRARCETPTMNDGCQWRKYGQKIAKGNPCPRAYYRCTVAPSCPVRKQVQRCADDMSILITTYEGTHNHPLPVSATAMASTTTAAASMLLSGSSTSNPGRVGTHPTQLNGLSFSPFDHSRNKPLYLPNTPPPLFPTITLDLTSSTSSTHFNRFASHPKFPLPSLSFSPSEPKILPTVWGNGHLNNGIVIYNRTHQLQDNLHQPFAEKTQTASREVLTEILTRAITSDPSLRTVVAAAIQSIVGLGTTNVNPGGEHLQSISSNLLSQNGKGCSTNLFDRMSSASSHQTGSLMHVQPSLPFSIAKSTTTPSVIGGQIKH